MATANSAVFSAELNAEVAMPTRRGYRAPTNDNGIMRASVWAALGFVTASVACTFLLFVFVDVMTHALNFGAQAVGLG